MANLCSQKRSPSAGLSRRRIQRNGRNPFASATNPREYSAWYHQHHPGYFAKKTKEWLERQPKRRKSALIAKRNRKNRLYINVYKKLQRRIYRDVKTSPTFTMIEMKTIRRSSTLRRMYREVGSR